MCALKATPSNAACLFCEALRHLWCFRRERITESNAGSLASMAPRQVVGCASLAGLLDEFSNQAGPPGLMIGADASTVVAVKVFVKQNEVFPVRVALEHFDAARHGAPSIRPAQEEMNQAAREVRGHGPQIHFVARTRGAFDTEILAVIVMKFLQRFDNEVVDGKPDRSAPIGIAAKNSRG